ncbi:hypothetical protein LTR37_019793 [Vermiconidia calcicola]|uniref:Uncharacterized protein n=1 Tax=Vermiconidia calcicola TaxID=1690605 RepID=A0ACC3MG83_9PEZI|nr:hypothetical protein LTR37_019793 [Vermiconidia calcicola]
MSPFSYFDSELWEGRAFNCYDRHFDRTLTACFRNRNSARFPHQLPQISSRWKRMLILQPPIKTMDVTLRCYPPHTYTGLVEPSLGKATSETGLTLGDLCEWTEKISLEHECDWPNHHYEVKFKGETDNL